MDNLVLIQVARALGATLRAAILREFRQEAPRRFRLIFDAGQRRHSVILSLRPEEPWAGHPAVRQREFPPVTQGPLALAASKMLAGGVVEEVAKPWPDRVLRFRFAGGGVLLAELAPHHADLTLIGAGGMVVASLRRGRGARNRQVSGESYRRPTIPGKRLDPFTVKSDVVDALVRRAAAEQREPLDALVHSLFGIGKVTANLVLEEARATGDSPGAVLMRRLAGLRAGRENVVVEAPGEPLELASRGEFGAETVALLPWEPRSPRSGWSLYRRGDAAGTAGLFHEAKEKALRVRGRLDSLLAILRRERRRLWEGSRRAQADRQSFSDPERYRIRGEALLAGLGAARRVGDRAFVPDPYDPEGGEIEVPATPGMSLPEAADRQFQRYRKARRGLETAALRAEHLQHGLDAVDRILGEFENARDERDVLRLEETMRSAGIPVGLEAPTRSGRAAARVLPARLEGVRIFDSSQGWMILVGKTGRDNARLTFRLAAPEDFWLHAHGCAGAHVVVRNPDRRARLPEATLREAAAAAAWFSDAREQAGVDVQWTRRKYVRRVRGAPPGTVTLKRFQTVRVRPAAPPAVEGPR